MTGTEQFAAQLCIPNSNLFLSKPLLWVFPNFAQFGPQMNALRSCVDDKAPAAEFGIPAGH